VSRSGKQQGGVHRAVIRKGTVWPGEFTEEELRRYAPLHEMHGLERGFVEWRARLCNRQVFEKNSVALLAYDLGRERALRRALKRRRPEATSTTVLPLKQEIASEKNRCGALPEFRPSRGETVEPDGTSRSDDLYRSNMIFIETICRVAHFFIAAMTLGAAARGES
jgi:hypothetical protein